MVASRFTSWGWSMKARSPAAIMARPSAISPSSSEKPWTSMPGFAAATVAASRSAAKAQTLSLCSSSRPSSSAGRSLSMGTTTLPLPSTAKYATSQG